MKRRRLINRRCHNGSSINETIIRGLGVHFGHQTRRWNLKWRNSCFTERNGIYIIDLSKTVKKVEEAYNFLREVASQGEVILFVGTKKQAQEAIKKKLSVLTCSSLTNVGWAVC